MLAERGIEIDHTSIYRWVVEYSPELEKEFRKSKKSIGKSCRMDETYIKIKGVWHYLYRAVDKVGQTIDFYLSPHRDDTSAKRFFKKAIRSSGKQNIVNIDKSGSNASALNNISSSHKPEFQIKFDKISI